MPVRACNSSTRKQEDGEFKTSLDYRVRTHLKKKYRNEKTE